MLNKYSKNVTQDPSQPAAQAMLHAIGLTDDDFKKPFVGIASTGYEGNPCNMHLNDLSSYIKTSINNSEIVGLIFNTNSKCFFACSNSPMLWYAIPRLL